MTPLAPLGLILYGARVEFGIFKGSDRLKHDLSFNLPILVKSVLNYESILLYASQSSLCITKKIEGFSCD